MNPLSLQHVPSYHRPLPNMHMVPNQQRASSTSNPCVPACQLQTKNRPVQTCIQRPAHAPAWFLLFPMHDEPLQDLSVPFFIFGWNTAHPKIPQVPSPRAPANQLSSSSPLQTVHASNGSTWPLSSSSSTPYYNHAPAYGQLIAQQSRRSYHQTEPAAHAINLLQGPCMERSHMSTLLCL